MFFSHGGTGNDKCQEVKWSKKCKTKQVSTMIINTFNGKLPLANLADGQTKPSLRVIYQAAMMYWILAVAVDFY